MKTALFLVACLLVASIFCLGYLNRASDKVLSAILSGLGVSTLAVIVSIFYAENYDAKTVISSAVYYRGIDFDLQPPFNGWRTRAQFELTEYRLSGRRIPKDSNERRRVIHQMLQASIIETLREISSRTWRFSSVETSYPWLLGRQRVLLNATPEVAGDIITDADIARLAPENPFLSKNSFANGGEIRVPPKMSLRVASPAPVLPGAPLDQGVIELKGPLATLTITTIETGSGHGAPEMMKPYLTPYAYDSGNYDYQGFVIDIRASYNKWRIGDPDMSDLRNWLNTATSTIASDYDEGRLWDDFKIESATLAKAEELHKVRNGPVEPARKVRESSK